MSNKTAVIFAVILRIFTFSYCNIWEILVRVIGLEPTTRRIYVETYCIIVHKIRGMGDVRGNWWILIYLCFSLFLSTDLSIKTYDLHLSMGTRL